MIEPGVECPAAGAPATADDSSCLISAAELFPVGKPFECPGVEGSLKPLEGLGDVRIPEPLAPVSSATAKSPPFAEVVPREPLTCAAARPASCACDTSEAFLNPLKPSGSASAQLSSHKSVRFSDAGAASEAACRRTSAACHSPPRDGAPHLVSGDSRPDPPRSPRVESNLSAEGTAVPCTGDSSLDAARCPTCPNPSKARPRPPQCEPRPSPECADPGTSLPCEVKASPVRGTPRSNPELPSAQAEGARSSEVSAGGAEPPFVQDRKPLPGSCAMPCTASLLWDAWFGAVSSSDCALSVFFHSLRELPRQGRGPAAASPSAQRRVWPMPLPYPELLVPGVLQGQLVSWQ